MPDQRKPFTGSSRADNAPPRAEESGFSIETTTMRLKSLKLRRAEAADKALEVRHGAPGDQVEMPAQPGPTGRVRHDERGMAVWDWAAASGEVAGLSATHVMRKLDVTGLSIEQTQRSLKAMQPVGRDAVGGSDPYNALSPARGDPFTQGKRAGGPGGEGDPYNQRANSQRTAPPMKRPAPTTPVKRPDGPVLDQLLGKKK
jgi:hypothetical protein